MTLYDQKKENHKNTEVNIDNSNALNTEEIISILSKTNNDFIKESQISSGISKLFKKKKLKDFAKNLKNNLNLEKEKTETKHSDLDNRQNEKSEDDIKKEEIPEKTYTEDEVKKIANEVANKNYYKGFDEGIKKIKSELEQGDEALALSLKNLTDNLFSIGPDFSKKINDNVSLMISDVVREILGLEIDKNAKVLIDKISKLAESITNELNNVVVFLNKKDFESVNKYVVSNKIILDISFEKDANLNRGDIKLKSGNIEINEIQKNVRFANLSSTDITNKNDLQTPKKGGN